MTEKVSGNGVFSDEEAKLRVEMFEITTHIITALNRVLSQAKSRYGIRPSEIIINQMKFDGEVSDSLSITWSGSMLAREVQYFELDQRVFPVPQDPSQAVAST
jgi:hypothetical protein